MKVTILALLFSVATSHSQDGNQSTNEPYIIKREITPMFPGNPQDLSDKVLVTGLGNEGGVLGDDEKLEVEQLLNESLRIDDKQALRDLKAIYEKAIATKDLELIKPHLAPDFTAVMITADEVKDYDGIKAYWKKVEEFIGKDGTYTVSIVPDDTLFEGNIAIAKGIANEKVIRKGKNIEILTKWTAIARKEGETWKLVRIQATIDPVKNPIVTALGKARLWITGAVAAVAGLLIGLLLRRIGFAKPITPN